MSTPETHFRKYHHLRLGRPPTSVWSPALGKPMKIKQRAKCFRQAGFKVSCLLSGKLLKLPLQHKKMAIVGSRIPFEFCSRASQKGACEQVYDLCIHQVHYADRKEPPLSARVAVFLPGGIMKMYTASARVTGPVIGIQAWALRPPHLRRTVRTCRDGHTFCSDHSNIVLQHGGPSILLTVVATAYGSNNCVVLPYHLNESKWVCPSCGKLFKSAFELAQHDNLPSIFGQPRVLLGNGTLGNVFRPPKFNGKDSWKAQAIAAINQGDGKRAMEFAPTIKNKQFLNTLTRKLSLLTRSTRPF